MVAPIYKEWFVLSTIIIQNVATGISYSYPSILSPAITSNSSDIFVTKDEASWIAAAYSMVAPIGNILMPIFMQMFGRRYTNIGINLFTIVGSVIIATSPNFTTLVTGRVIQGLVDAKLFICNIIIGEYSHPTRRGITVTVKFAAVNSGLLICVGLSSLLDWRQIAWLQVIPAILGLVSTFFWPESPYWLAYKGRYQDCEDSFRWLRGNDLESRKELRELLAAQREMANKRDKSTSYTRISKMIRCKGFLKPLFILSMMSWFGQASGAFYLYAYIIEIFTEITGDTSKALYFSQGIGLVKIFGSFMSAILIVRFQRRHLFFSSGFLAVCLLAFTSLFDYLNRNSVLVSSLLPGVILVLYCFVIHITIPLFAVATGEFFPVEYKGFGTACVLIIWSLLGSVTLKFTSNLLTSIYTYGTFSVYLVLMSGSLIILYFITPEAKDRTLQDIENKLLDIKLSNTEEAEMIILKN